MFEINDEETGDLSEHLEKARKLLVNAIVLEEANAMMKEPSASIILQQVLV